MLDADDFNPRSREGSDHGCEERNLVLRISIHAPVKGATVAVNDGGKLCEISIHAPVKGATTCT